MKRLISISLLAGALFSCQSHPQGKQSGNAPLVLPVVEVTSQSLTSYNSYPASLEGTVTSAVRAKVSGYITEVLVDEGESVKQGQPLFKLETQSLSKDAEAAKANVNAARVEVDRLRPLVEKKIISQVQLETAKARLAQAEATYNSIAANISYATIRSPINGYVGAINFRKGALISPADPAPLTTVSDVDTVYAFFAMNERDYLNFLQKTSGETLTEKIQNFPPVRLRLVNDSVYVHDGVIETVTGQVDASTGAVKFRAKFPNPARLLASGNSGNILIPQVNEGPVVPEIASFERQGRVYVYKVVGDTVAVETSINVKDRVNNLIVVGSGIKAGEKVVAQGVGKIQDNTPIQPQPVDYEQIANSVNVVFK